jgi:hypothetical protein
MENMEFIPDDEMLEDFTGVRINPRDVVGHLLLIWVIDYLPHKPTQFSRPDKPSDVIVVDVVDLDAIDPETNQPGLLARHTWWRQARLIQKLKPKVGTPHPWIARMAKGGASTGYNAPFVLNGAAEEPGAKERAREWASRNVGFQPSTPFQGLGDSPSPHSQPQVETSAPTILEQLAAQGQRGADRMGQMGRPQSGSPPF